MDVATRDLAGAEPGATGGRRPHRFVVRATIGAAVATLVNLGIYALAELGGVSFRLRGQVDVFITAQALTSGFRRVHAYNIAIDTAVPFLLGALLFHVAARRSRSAAFAVLFLAAIAAVVVLNELPQLTAMSARTSMVLALMDVVAVASFIVIFARALPPARDASARTPRGHPDRSPHV
jgi:hypothetical protein